MTLRNPNSKSWGMTKMPQFKRPDGSKMKALVLPGAFYGSVVALMAEAGFEKAEDIKDCDVLVFAGGADVDPALYGEQPLSQTSFSRHRDDVERVAYDAAQAEGKVCFGICRGAQFLHVMNGGELWQDVQNHAGQDHSIYDLEEDVYLDVTSVHHQMLRDHTTLQIMAVCDKQVSTVFKGQGLTIDLSKEGVDCACEIEIEAGRYDKTKCFFVQGHPEIGSKEYRTWTMTKLKDLMSDWNEGQDTVTYDAITVRPEDLTVDERMNLWKETIKQQQMMA